MIECDDQAAFPTPFLTGILLGRPTSYNRCEWQFLFCDNNLFGHLLVNPAILVIQRCYIFRSLLLPSWVKKRDNRFDLRKETEDSEQASTVNGEIQNKKIDLTLQLLSFISVKTLIVLCTVIILFLDKYFT